MSTAALTGSISVDEFQALEQTVLKAVEIVKREREARAAADAQNAALQTEIAALRAQLATHNQAQADVQTQLTTLNQERDLVRQRVEKMLHQIDELL